MNIKGTILTSLAFVLAALPIAAHAQKVEFNGHTYEVITYPATGVPNNSWAEAKTAADNMDYLGVNGYLATITSEDEDIFVDGLREAALTGSGTNKQAWIGGSQLLGQSAPGAGWSWENGEGTIPGSTQASPYAKWGPSEPNDGGGGENNAENHLTLGRYGLGGGWNDEGVALNTVLAFVVEWDAVSFTPEECFTSCQSSPNSTVTLDEDNVVIPDPGNASISFRTVSVFDDGLSCGNPAHMDRPFVIPGIGGDPDLTLNLKWYMCGAPKFLVVVSKFEGVEIPFGTVEVRNEPEFADVTSFGCDNVIPATDLPPFLNNPVEQDIAITQNNDPMLEVSGGAEEGTNECGSTRMRYRGGTLLPIGVYFEPGIVGTYPGNADAIEQWVIGLTRIKLERTLIALSNAENAGAIKRGDFKKMTNAIHNSIRQLDRGEFEKGLAFVDKFMKFVNKAKYHTADLNYNGLHTRMGSNLQFMYSVKVIPYAQ